MKGISLFDKIILFLNTVAIMLLLVACGAPHIDLSYFSFLSFLGLAVPALVTSNILFLFYWVIKRKKWLIGSLLALIIGYFVLGTFIKWANVNEKEKGDFSVISYNVRFFNRFKELESRTVLQDIKAFVKEENPDFICFQEPLFDSGNEFKEFPHRYLERSHMEGVGLLTIFSKYPIVNKGMIRLPKTYSNAVFADINYKNDTLRIYNVHLESLGITPGAGAIRSQPAQKVFKQVNHAFKKQLEQAKVIRAHINSSPYRTILCGDFNNSQYSNVYQTIKGDFQDTFLEEGRGYGRTLNFHGVPVRIDFIFADESFEVRSHSNYDVKYSDHFPVKASFKLRTD